MKKLLALLLVLSAILGSACSGESENTDATGLTDSVEIKTDSFSTIIENGSESTNPNSIKVCEVKIKCNKRTIIGSSISYNDRYSLYLLYDKKNSKECPNYSNMRIRILDKKEGKLLTDELPLFESADEYNFLFSYEDGYLIICSYTYDDTAKEITFLKGFKITEQNGKFSMTSTEITEYTERRNRIFSPDGNYSVYFEYTDIYGRGGLYLESKDDGRKLIQQLHTYEELSDLTEEQERQIQYVPVGFIDNTRILFNIAGYEAYTGCAVYDITLGEFTDIDSEKIAFGLNNKTGVIVKRDINTEFRTPNYYYKYYTSTLSGEDVLFAEYETDTSYNEYESYQSGRFLRYNTDTLEIMTDDCKSVDTVINLSVFGNSIINLYDNLITFVTLEKTE